MPETPVFRTTVRGGVPAANQNSKATCRVDVEDNDSDYDEKVIRQALGSAKARGKTVPAKPAGAP